MPQNIDRNEPFVQGELWKPLFTVLDADLAVVDLTTADTETWVVMKLQGSSTTVTRTTATAAQRSWESDGSDGQVRFIFKPADTLNITKGDYDVSLWWKNSSTDPKQQFLKGSGVWHVVAPASGAVAAP